MKKYITLAFAAVLALACSKENASIPATKVAPIITADFNQDPLSKVEFANGLKLQWEIGDIIKVANQTGSSEILVKYEVTSIDPSTGRASFKLCEGEDLSRFGEGTTFWAHFGKTDKDCGYISNDATYKGCIKTIIETTSTVVAGSIKNNYTAIAVATLTDGKLSFNFKSALSFLKITIPSSYEGTIKKIKILTGISTASNYPTGYGVVGFSEDGTPTSWRRSAGGSANAAYQGTLTAGNTYYLPIYPGRTVSAKNFQISTDGSTYTTIGTVSFTTEYGKVINLGTLPLK